MSGKILARASAISLALILAACGGDDDSASLGGVTDGGTGGTGGDSTTDSGSGDTTDPVLVLGNGTGGSFVEGQLNADTTNLQAGGNTVLSMSIVDAANSNQAAAGEERTVAFTSRCISSGDAEINGSTTTSSGLIEVEYQATGCAGEDTVTASFDGATATTVLTIAPADPRSLISQIPVPQSIAPIGNATDGRPSSSTVSFNVVDEKGNPVRDVEVNFRLSYSERAPSAVQDVKLDKTTTTSGPSGIASTDVIAGQHNTVVRVIASIELQNGSIAEVVSAPITISMFLPDQDSFSIVADRYAPNAQTHNNVEVTITVNGADRFNNNDLEASGAVINFVTTGGSIDNYCILNDEGICTVTWTSGDPRPATGRISILARSVGEESFFDANSDDAFQTGEFTPQAGVIFERGEAFLDYNTNRAFDSGVDRFFDYDGNAQYDGPDGTYDGSACIDPDNQNCTPGPVVIWDQIPLLMASDEGINATLAATGNPNEFCVTASGSTSDGTQIPLPSGTSIEFSIEDGEFISQTTSFTVQGGYNSGSTTSQCVSAEPDDDPATTARLSVSITPPAPFGGAPTEDSITF